jgi:hypothetical protein
MSGVLAVELMVGEEEPPTNECPVAPEFPGNERQERGRGEREAERGEGERIKGPRCLKGRREEPKSGRENHTRRSKGCDRLVTTPSARARTTNVIYQAEEPEESSTRFRNLRTPPPAMHWAGGGKAEEYLSTNNLAPPHTNDRIIDVWINRAGGIRIGVHGPAGAVNTGKERAARCCYSRKLVGGAPAAPQDNVGDGGSPQGSRPSEGEGCGGGSSEAGEEEEGRGGGAM